MPALPDGAPPPHDGHLPDAALEELGTRPFGVYLHVPFCAARCGYCDFNTYTVTELTERGEQESAVSQFDSWFAGVRAELRLAAEVLRRSARGLPPRVDTVFVGGGTPSLLGADRLSEVLALVRDTYGLAADAEVTTEANPESTSAGFFEQIRAAGFTRVSLGMQSAAPHVLSVLERRHTPGRASEAAKEVRAAGFDHVNLDLIYGTPGETAEDLDLSVAAALESGVDHVSAYGLIVEEGTALARRVNRGQLPAPDDDVLAERYERLDRMLEAAGLQWYEVSNWARSPAARCRHNLGYWQGGDWWGAGPGAHSHVGGVRWWNVRHPSRYAALLARGCSPAAGREVLGAQQVHTEDVMLRLRLAEGLDLGLLDSDGRREAAAAVADGLLHHLTPERVALTRRGRLLADGVIARLLP